MKVGGKRRDLRARQSFRLSPEGQLPHAGWRLSLGQRVGTSNGDACRKRYLIDRVFGFFCFFLPFKYVRPHAVGLALWSNWAWRVGAA
jgi:hypothetical protein